MNLRKLRYVLLLYCAFDFFLGGKCGGFLELNCAAAAQFTTVSGTVTDPNGLPYANGTITATLVSSGSPTFTVGGAAYTPPTQPVGLSAAGSFVMQLADVTALTPGGSTYSFTVSCAAGCVPPVIGKGPIQFTVTGITISGASQSITATLTAAAPALTAVVGGGGSGTVSAGTATQLAIYNSSSTVVSSNPRLTDNGTTLAYTGAGGFNAGPGGITTSGTHVGASASFTGVVSAGSFTWTGNVSAHQFFGNNTGSATAPSMLSIGLGDLPTTLVTSPASGTANTFPKYTGAATTANSLLTDNGSTLAYSGGGGLSLTGGSAGTISLTGCAPGTFVKADGTGCGTGLAAGATTYASAFTGLASAIAGAGGAQLVWNDVSQTLSSSFNINTSNLTLRCTSPQAPIIFSTAAVRMQVANGSTAKNVTIERCNFQGPDLATATGAPIVVGGNGDGSGFKLLNTSINGFGSTGGNGVVEIVNASHVDVVGNRSGDIAVGSTCTVSTASWAPAVSGKMYGLETITFAASGACASAFPSDFAVSNALLCNGMTPVVYNHPGDGASLPFGQIISVAYPSLTVQQLVNPGTYVSGGTCQAGIGNGEPSIVFNVVSNNNQLTDWNIFGNDVDSVTVHQATVGSTVNGVRFGNNKTHVGLGGAYVWGLELGSFSGVTGAMAQTMTGVAEANNICNIVADGTAGCYSQGNSQGLTETGNQGYSNGHVYTIQMDENAGAQNISNTGGIFNALGGGSIEDINRVNNSTIANATFLYPAATAQFMSGGAASGGVGAQAPASSSGNSIGGITMVSRAEICPPAGSAWANNVCAAQILNIVGNGVTATVTFTPGTTIPGLAAGQTQVIAGNSVGGFNVSATVASVIGGGTGFTFSSATNATGTGGKSTGDGLTNISGTTATALFTQGPTPFKNGDTTFTVTGATNTAYNCTNCTVIAVGQGPPPYFVSYTIATSGNTASGNGFAGIFNGKFVSFQNNIAAGSVVDRNTFYDLRLIGNGGTASQGISFSNNASTSGSMDRNQFTHIAMSDIGNGWNLAGTGTLAPTNSKIEMGSFTNVNSLFATWNNGASITCDSANPSCLIGTGTGVCTSSVTLFLYNLGQTAATTCTGTTEGPSGFQTAKSAGTVQGLFCTSSAVGVSGVVTVRDNAVNKSITCSLAGVTSCNDTAHNFLVAQGDLLDIQIATGAAETLANPKCTLLVWYKDN